MEEPIKKITNQDPESQSSDIVAENIETLKALFPEIITEGDGQEKINFETLKEVLGEHIEEKEERYNFNWHGKSKARRLAQAPSSGTLRPCREESVDWENTENLFIEGDNLEVLKLLQKSYHKKVKMIYIDPPYNTGGEFIYPDNFTDNLDTYLKYTGQQDKEGRKFSTNTEQSGRYHTNWLNMMLPRLKTARNLLKDDGVIFISIDDNEVENIRRILNEVFGEDNFIASIIWQKVYAPKNTAQYFSEDHDYVIVYAKNKNIWRPTLLERTAEQDALYKNPDNDSRGPWMSDNLTARNYYGAGQYELTGPTGKIFTPGRGRYWRSSIEKFKELEKNNRIWWGANDDGMPRLKRFLSEVSSGRVPQTLWSYKEVGHTQDAKRELLEYVDFQYTENVLNSVKPIKLLKQIIKIGTSVSSDEIVLDFFSGSAPTGHAVLDINKEDKGTRRFILVQLPEPLKKPEKDFKTIADLGKSRLRNYISKNDNVSGFKVFKLDSTNINPWEADFDTLEAVLDHSADSIKKERSAEDILYEILLKYGLDLTLPIETHSIAEKTVYAVGMGALIVCLDDALTLEVVEEIGKLKEQLQPELMRVVFRDSGFTDDVVKTNAVQVLKQFGIDDVRSI